MEPPGARIPCASTPTSLGSLSTSALGEPTQEGTHMTAATAAGGQTAPHPAAGAPAHDQGGWHAIAWPAAHDPGRRLQARIVQATPAGRGGKGKALQRLRTHACSGTVRAVKRVTAKPGQPTPGVARAIGDTPAQQREAVLDLRQRGDRPRPLRRVRMPQSHGQRRPRGIPTMRERAMPARSLLALAPVAETTADPHSYGVSQERSSAAAMMPCSRILARKGSAPWVLEGASTSCCDTRRPDGRLTHGPMDTGGLRQWWKAGDRAKQAFHPTEAGTPHGGIASPVLAHLALAGLERRRKEPCPTPHGEPAERRKGHMGRYADDCLSTGPSQELRAGEVTPCVEPCMQERGRELAPEKTVSPCGDNGCDGLGHHVRTANGPYLAKPSRKNVPACLEKVRSIVKANKQAQVDNLLGLRTPVIRGWATSHRHDARKAPCGSGDAALCKGLWQWARRRHPKKHQSWVKDTYCHTQGDRRWVCSGTDRAEQGKPRPVWLCSASTRPSKRPRKMQAGANPSAPAWEVSFAPRLGVKRETHRAGQRQRLPLWKAHGGSGPVCTPPLTEIERWPSHHIIWRTQGGKDSVDNRVLLHPHGHRQVHHRGLTVVQPCPARGKRAACAV
jgi:RNA-directed DNA polymerase